MLVATLVALVFLNKVEIVATDDDRALHLRGVHDPAENASADGDVAGEGALLVDVGPVDRRYGCVIAHADGLVEAEASRVVLSKEAPLEDLGLLVIRSLVLVLSHLVSSLAQSLGSLKGSSLAVWIRPKRVSPANLRACVALLLVLRR